MGPAWLVKWLLPQDLARGGEECVRTGAGGLGQAQTTCELKKDSSQASSAFSLKSPEDFHACFHIHPWNGFLRSKRRDAAAKGLCGQGGVDHPPG